MKWFKAIKLTVLWSWQSFRLDYNPLWHWHPRRVADLARYLALVAIVGSISGCASMWVGNSPEELKHREHPMEFEHE